VNTEHWFIDETKQKQFVFAIAAIEARLVGSCRSQMMQLPRQRSKALHFNQETPANRSGALRAIAQLPVALTLVAVPSSVRPRDRREAAVRAVANLAAAEQPRRIVFERDASTQALDRKWLHEKLVGLDVEYQHLDKSSDALLWLADGVAWASQRGGSSLDLIQGRIKRRLVA